MQKERNIAIACLKTLQSQEKRKFMFLLMKNNNHGRAAKILSKIGLQDTKTIWETNLTGREIERKAIVWNMI